MKRIIAMVFTAAFLLTGCNNASDNSSFNVSTDTTSQKLINGDIAEYPENNIFGLKSIREEINDSSKIITFTFKHKKNVAVNSSILSESNSISGLTHYGSFTFDESEVIDKGKYFDVVLTYDSRITLTSISFDFGDERCNIYLKEDIELVYCDFRDSTLTKRIYQNYNTENMSWDERYDEEESNTEFDGIEYGTATVKEIDYEDKTRYPVNSFGDLKFKATEYQYTQNAYNIYGEITRPALTTLRFDLIDEKNPIKVTICESDIRLYKKTEEKYTEITPKDISLTLNSYNNDKNLAITMGSSTLGDLEEGDYRVECREYYVDFSIAMHTYEFW